MRDMRNVAAEKTMPERLDPDPIHACPAPFRRAELRGRRRRAPSRAVQEHTEQTVATFVGEEPALSRMASHHVMQKSTDSPDRKKRDRTVELPPIVRNPENRRRRVKLPEAMREIGLDESALAEMMMQLLLKLRGASEHEAAEVARDKFLLEVVKESARMLDGSKSAGSEMPDEVPTILRLTHHIPRPVREGAVEQ